MNHGKLTKRNLEILLFLIFIPFLAITGRAQEPERANPAIDSETVQFEEQAKDQDRQRSAQRFSSRWSRTIKGEKTSSAQPGSARSNFAVFGDIGVSVPHGDFNIFFDPGFSVNTGLEYMITSQFSVEGSLGYHQFRRLLRKYG